MHPFRGRAGAAVLAAVLISGCGDPASTPVTPTPSASPAEAPAGNPDGIVPYRVRDIRPGPASSLADPATGAMVAFRGRVLFVADDGVRGLEPWSSDGTAAGTAIVADICPGACGSIPAWITVHGDRALFQADDGTRGRELWTTDGTPGGTGLVMDIRPGAGSSSPAKFAPLGDGFAIEVASPDGGRELWTTDGTPAGTRFVIEIAPRTGGIVPGPWIAADGLVYFGNDDGVSGRELWVTDGTPLGTRLVRDVCPGPCDALSSLVAGALGRRLVFAARDAPGLAPRWWVTDGTPAGTRSLGLVAFPSATPPVALGTAVLLVAAGGVGQPELWRSDGTPAGTTLVRPMAAANFFEWNGRVLMSGFESAFGAEPWVTDGTPGGTRPLGEVNPGIGSSSPRGFAAHGGHVYFAAGTARGSELWRTDGTPAGTVPVAGSPDLGGSAAFERLAIASAGGRLFFPGSDAEAGLEPWAYRPPPVAAGASAGGRE